MCAFYLSLSIELMSSSPNATTLILIRDLNSMFIWFIKSLFPGSLYFVPSLNEILCFVVGGSISHLKLCLDAYSVFFNSEKELCSNSM